MGKRKRQLSIRFPFRFTRFSLPPFPVIPLWWSVWLFGRQVVILFFTWGFYPNALSVRQSALASFGRGSCLLRPACASSSVAFESESLGDRGVVVIRRHSFYGSGCAMVHPGEQGTKVRVQE